MPLLVAAPGRDSHAGRAPKHKRADMVNPGLLHIVDNLALS